MIHVYTLYMHDAKKFIWCVQTAHLFSWILEWQLHSCEYYLSIKLAWQKSLSIIFISLLTINRMLNLDKILCLHVQTRLRYCRGLGHMTSYADDAPCTVVCTGHGTARAPHLRVMQSILKRTQAYSKYALYNTIPGLATRRYIYSIYIGGVARGGIAGGRRACRLSIVWISSSWWQEG